MAASFFGAARRWLFKKAPENSSDRLTAARAFGLTVLAAAATLHTVRSLLVDFVAVDGPSMLPTFNEHGDVVLCEKLTAKTDLRVGDVVIVKSADRPQLLLCKRVAGLPNQPYRVVQRSTYLGDVEAERVIPPGHLWLRGDNPDRSNDSSTFGPVPQGLVEGRVFARAWPLRAACWVPRGDARPLVDELVQAIEI